MSRRLAQPPRDGIRLSVLARARETICCIATAALREDWSGSKSPSPLGRLSECFCRSGRRRQAICANFGPEHMQQDACAEVGLLDHLGGTQQEWLRHGEAECFCSLEVYQQLALRWLLDQQVAGLCTLKNLVDVVP